ncbi:M1 family aminopeptidase [Myxococcus sp. NMCA1]|uniref:M1 family aminopeptidase n=1 Tax=Myxococcus sp. NMCA1 TaxID=2996785 RepID=UPI002286C8BB|nr:M1 family aminopeptidase [Myxococcus sp. NMCA1]WAM27193.1 M1 family aminopeptidase [Myxococcus sp. NMCA1]
MAGELIRFEWRFQTRQAAFLVAVAAFLGMAFVFVGTGYGPDNAHVNSPASVMQSLGFLSLFSIFVLSAFCANAALRDSEHRMEALVYATPVSKLTYLSVRLAGALLAALAVFSVTALGMMLAPWVLDVAPERRGSWEVLRYAWALAVMVLPNLLFAASLLFAVATLTRSALATYVGAVFLYALYFVGALLGDSPLMAGTAPQTPEALARAALLDPFGLSAFFAQTRYWTEHERNTRLLHLEGAFLHNRLLWLGVSAGVLAFVYQRFSFRAASGATPRSIASETAAPGSVPYRPVEPERDEGARFRAALVSTWKMETHAILKSRAFLALMALWVFVLGMEVAASATQAEYGTRLLPTTGLLLQAIQPPLFLFGSLCVVYFGAELVWRERGVRLSELLDATPASSAVFYLSKLAVLALQVLVLTASAVGIAVLYQLSRGHRPLEPALYLSLLYFSGLPLLLFAVAVLWLQTLSPHRYVGMFLGLLLALAMRQGGLVGLEHGLLRYASGPPLRYSDMNGFGASVHGFNAYMVYWSALAGVLGLLTCGLWRRGVSPPLRARLAALPQVWGRRGQTAVTACLALFVLAGGFIFHGTNVLNRYETRAQLADWKADYEKAYQRYESFPQPSIVAVKARVDLYPEEARYHATGRYVLENRTQAPIQRVWLSVRRDVRHATLSLQGARQVHHDSRFGMSAFELDTPLPPGAKTGLAFSIETERRGIREGARDTSIAGNGSFISNQEAFPAIGYRKGYELDDARERRQRGLPETPRVEAEAAGDLGLAEGGGGQRAWTTLDLTVSTPDTQLAVAPGELRQTWNEEDRRVFRYVMERPMLNWFALVSARYAVKKEKHRGVDVEVYYHPGHAHNVERMLRAATRSLEVLEEQLGRYPHRQLRIVEVPSTWGFGALALSNTIYYPEHRGFLTASGEQDTVDLITRRIAHEVAHQWWGHQVDPVSGPGGLLITESLAKYAEQRVLKALHGEAQVRQVLAFDLDRYLRGRAEEHGEEPPLLQTKDEPYLYYGKGAVVMHALADLLGEAALDRALRKLVQQHAHPKPQPTASDLLALLHEEATEEARPLVDQWLTQVVLYELKVESAAVEPLADGRYRVTARISASKHARQNGQDVPLPMNESLDVAVLSQDATLYAAKHRFTGGITEVSLTVDQRPVSIGVDPFLRRVSLERTGTVWKLEQP